MRFKDWLTKEIIDGFSKWFKYCCYCIALIYFLDLLPKLPDELSGPIVDLLMSKLK